MKKIVEEELVSLAFRQFVKEVHIENRMEMMSRRDELAALFESFPWDEKIFTIHDANGMTWAADVFKEGPTLVLEPVDGGKGKEIHVKGSAFWKSFLSAFKYTSFGAHLLEDKGFWDAFLHGRQTEESRYLQAEARREHEKLCERRRNLRMQRQERSDSYNQQIRENKNQDYWVFYQ
ncbi:hypothetical protein CCP2SC5_30068 [Azospirillaceae bacterium]